MNGDASAYDEDDVVAHRHGDGGVREYESVVDGDGSAYIDGRDDDNDDDDDIAGGDAPAIDEAPTFDSDYENQFVSDGDSVATDGEPPSDGGTNDTEPNYDSEYENQFA